MDTDPNTIEVNAQNFQEVAEKSRTLPVLLEFYAEGAEQCAPVAALLQKLVQEYQGKVFLGRVNIQENQQLVQQLQVRALPSVKIIFDGQMAGNMEGQVDEQQLRQALDQLTMSPLERIKEQIDFLLEQGQRAQAIQMLQQVIAEEPGNTALQVELCDLLIMEGDIDSARRILSGLPADAEGIDKPRSRLEFIDLAGELAPLETLRTQAESGDLEDRFALAIRLVVEDQVEAALEVLLEMMKTDKAWGDEKARKTMIKVFDMLGKGNELATAYRRKMFTYLH